MSMSDPIADMIVRIKNASRAKHPTVDMPSSKFKAQISQILAEEGYIGGYFIENQPPGKKLTIELKFDHQGSPVIHGIKRISKPGLRKYLGHEQLPKVMGGLGTAILSTSSGVMTEKVAKNKGVGGEVIAYVW
jgi:small subunit ribosomal protein S8